MRDVDKRKDQLVNELVEMRRHIAKLEASQAKRKKAEDALRQSEARFRSIFENANDEIVQLDKFGTVIDVNDKVEEIFGYKRDEVIGRKFTDIPIFKPDDLQRIFELFSNAVEHEVTPLTEVEALRKDGSTVIVEPSSSLIRKNGEIEGVLIIIRNVTERIQAEKSLRLSEEHFRALIENSLDAIAVLDSNLIMWYLTPSFERILGYKPEDMIGMNPLEYVDPDDMQNITSRFITLIQEPSSIQHAEVHALHKDGSWRTIEVLGTNLLDDPVVGGIVANFRDITERKRMEEDLRNSEERYRLLAENVTDVIWTMDMNLRFTYFSPSVEHQRGYTVEESLALSLKDITTPESFKVAVKAFEKEMAIEEMEEKDLSRTLTLELELYHKDGSTIWTELKITALRDPDGRAVGILGVSRDISERKRIEKALKESEENFRALAENSLHGITVIADEGVHVYANKEAAKITGYSIDEMLNNTFQDLVYHSDLDKLTERYKNRMEGKTVPNQYETIIVRKEGQTVPIEVSSTRTIWQGKPAAMVMFNDITERRKYEKKLEELYNKEREVRQRLEEEMHRRVEFTRALAHELKTPLTSVLASSDSLIEKLRDEPLLSLARNISRGAFNLNSRIDELLDLARGEVGMLELKPEPVNLLQLLREAADSMAPVAASQGQSLTLDLPPSLPMVRADAPRIQQVVLNLLSNALKFTPKDGKIKLRAKEKDGAIIAEVQDTGRGMSQEEQERLFEPYHRLDSDRGRMSGLGLGLALSRTLIELHGGKIWVKSQVGRGSTFSFSLPLQAGMQRVEEAEKIAKLWKVLIIEDDQEIVDSIALSFQMDWPEAELISTRLGEEGIDMAETESPDIVILDLGLPDINGFEVLRQIRLFSSVPIIILTVKADEADIIKGLEWGADDYVAKPFRQRELQARLKVQIRKQSATDEEAPIVCGPLRLDPSTYQLTYGGKEISLTIIEGRIIQYLMRNAGHVATHSRLAEAVWGEDYPGALDSLRVYIRYLREKLEEDPSNPKLIRTKAGVGYSLTKPA